MSNSSIRYSNSTRLNWRILDSSSGSNTQHNGAIISSLWRMWPSVELGFNGSTLIHMKIDQSKTYSKVLSSHLKACIRNRIAPKKKKPNNHQRKKKQRKVAKRAKRNSQLLKSSQRTRSQILLIWNKTTFRFGQIFSSRKSAESK